jgi:hypothetical protein
MAPNRQDQVDWKAPDRRRDISDAAPVVAEQSGRAERFLARLDSHLPFIADRLARRALLDRQLEGWERRYTRFIATDGASEPVTNPADPPQAADFLLTITGIAARRSALGEHLRGDDHMPEKTKPAMACEEHQGNDARLDGLCRQRPYGSAILSLLVAADQRCPAIIGQAHILYHARFSAQPEHAEKTFTQLKRDAADLFEAIAAVEAAMNESIPETK